MAARNPLPPQTYLRECFAYNPELGILLWRHRPREHFVSIRGWNSWNARFAGHPAGNRHPGRRRHSDGYLFIGMKGKLYAAHRIIWKLVTGDEPELLDHKDGNTYNNRWRNIRIATTLENNWNSRRKSERQLPRGVRIRESGRYEARARNRGKLISLGQFDTPEEAHAAFCIYAEPIRGEFFRKD